VRRTRQEPVRLAYIYSISENLVLWASSKKIGCAVIQHSWMMEYWSVGIMGLAEWDPFLWGWHGSEF
jgi:hypothetical protein